MESKKDKYKNPIYSKIVIAENERKRSDHICVVKGGEIFILDSKKEN